MVPFTSAKTDDAELCLWGLCCVGIASEYWLVQWCLNIVMIQDM